MRETDVSYSLNHSHHLSFMNRGIVITEYDCDTKDGKKKKKSTDGHSVYSGGCLI